MLGSLIVGPPTQYTNRPPLVSTSSICETSWAYPCRQVAGDPAAPVCPDGTIQSLVPMMNTTTSGSRRAISWEACFGQSKKSGFDSPLETRESKYGCTTPRAPVMVPRDGPSDPASESPPIHSRSGAAATRGDRQTGPLVAATGSGVEWAARLGCSLAATRSVSVATKASTTANTAASDESTSRRMRRRRCTRRRPRSSGGTVLRRRVDGPRLMGITVSLASAPHPLGSHDTGPGGPQLGERRWDTDARMAATPWPLVGRASELAAVGDAMDSAAAGVLFAGPPGVGKTRLATECLELAHERGWSSAVVRANRSAASIPYGAFAQYLPRSFRSVQGEPDALRQAAIAVREAGGDGPLLLVVDDAHELDDASAALLLLLGHEEDVFLVVTLRAGAAAPASVTDLWKDEVLERVDVPALEIEEAARLVRSALEGPVDGVTARSLWHQSGGNALFLRELVIGAREAGTLREVGGLWRLSGSLAPSTRLGEVVGLRLGALSEEEREVVELVAIGEPVSLDDLVELVRGRAIDELERRTLVEVTLEGRRRQVRMAHPLYGEVVRAGIPELRRREILRQLADVLEGHGAQRREDILRIAVWRLDAGGGGRPELLVAAAKQAHGAEDLPLAVRLAEAALEEGGGVEAHHILGISLDSSGAHERAEEVLRAGEAAVADPRRRVVLSIARADNLFRGLGRAEDAERVVQAAELTLDDPVLRDGLVALRAVFLVFEGRLTEAIKIVDALLTEGTDTAYAQGALAAAVGLALSGRTEASLEVAERGREARSNLGDSLELATEGIYLVAQALALLEAGQMKEAEELARLSYEGAIHVGAHHGQAWFATILGRIELHRGRPVSAARWSREGGVVFREIRHPSSRWGLGALACAEAMAGDLDAADAAFAVLDAEPATPVRVFDPEIDRGRAWVAALRGEHSRAREMLLDAADRATEGGALAIAAGALHDLARLGEPRIALERLDQIIDRVDGRYVAARRDHAAALVAGDGDALDRVSEEFEEVGALLLAVEAAGAASAQHQTAGLRRKATASAQRAGALLEECEGARPFSVASHMPGVSLTRREREIAELAARNLTSRDIADQLVLSSRTVENHLQRAYEKLGVSSRRELRYALDRGDSG